MAEKGIYDQAADEIVRRYGLVRNEIVRRNKGKVPFRMEKVPDEQLIQEYADFTPEKEQFALEGGMPPEAIEQYHKNMKNLIRGKGYA